MKPLSYVMREKNELEYDDTEDVRRMRSTVEKYNKLLEKTFIDIQSVTHHRIELLEGKRRADEQRVCEHHTP